MRLGACAGVRSLMLVVLLTSAGWAQRAEPIFKAASDSTVERAHHGWTPLRVAKWTTLAASTASVVYGFSQNQLADREYERIEQLCKQSPSQCVRNSNDAYSDAALEARYQSVVTRDHHARIALLAGQAGVAASVLMFVLDLHDAPPEDIPYEPKQLRLGFDGRDVRLEWHPRMH